MSSEDLVIGIVGAGAVGGYYGARLAQHGCNVHFLMRGDYAAVRRQGLTVKSCDGDFALPPQKLKVYDDPARMPKADLVIIALKATDDLASAPLVAPLIKEDTAILTLQNGLGNEELLAERFGPARVLGGLAFVCLNRTAPGVIHHLDYGYIRLGELAGGPSPRAHRIAGMFTRSQVRCDVLADLRYGRWEKLVWNIPFNGLGAALDLTTDRILATTAGEDLVRGIMGEVVATANALGVNLPAGQVIEQKIQQTRAMRPYRSSMQIDRQLGRPMEVEAIFGRPLRAAQAAGVPTPRLEAMYQMLRLLQPAYHIGVCTS